jgi:multicomponent Na+:H+ antiporter subunit G
VRQIVVIVLVLIGVAFSLSGAVGVVRLPDVYSRIQASSKTVTMGAVPALLAVAVGKGFFTEYGVRALLVAILLLTVNPAASHALARAAYKAGIRQWPGAMQDAAEDETR